MLITVIIISLQANFYAKAKLLWHPDLHLVKTPYFQNIIVEEFVMTKNM